MKAFVRQHPVLTFIILALGSQLAMVAVDLPLAPWCFRLTALVPFMLSVAITAWIDGGLGLGKLFLPLLHWRVPAKWYVLAVSWKFIAALGGIALVSTASTAAWPGSPNLDMGRSMQDIALAVVMALAEWTAWMRFAMTRMQQQRSALRSCVVVGLCWGLWHLIPMLLGESVPGVIPWWVFLLSMFGCAVLLCWIYNTTRSGPVTLITLAISNCALFIFPVITTGSIGTALVAVFFAGTSWVILWYGPEHLSDRSRVRWNEAVLRRVHVRHRDPQDGGVPVEAA